METKTSLFRNVARSFQVIGAHPFLFFFLAILVAGPAELLNHLITAWLQSQTSSWLPAHGVIVDPQKAGIFVMVATELLILPWVCVVGAFVLPAALRIYVRHTAGEQVDLNDTVNFALSRWSRVIKPLVLTTLIITVGNLIVVPGILYTLYFSFVLAVTTLDDTVKHPLVRSRKLVTGRIGRIFRLYVIFIFWWGWYRTIGEFFIQDLPIYLRLLLSTLDVIVTFAIELSILQLYFERMEQLKEALALRKSEATPAQKPGVLS